ncbi:uncharacterized protein JCM10292_004349 [Rhodotorula paludigena]|uniref:uncharacterized protein n=1 Tax=Rhodotorula paludigena TaxID=86838 RepID=UPI00316BE802
MRLPAFLAPRSASRPSHRAALPLHVLGDDDDDERSSSRDRGARGRDEATVPLTAPRDEADDDAPFHVPSPRKRSTRSAWSLVASLVAHPHVRRLLALAVVAVALYKVHRRLDYDHLRSKLDQYSEQYNPWHPKPLPTTYVDIEPSVRVRGRRYRAHQERDDDRFWAWKALPYAENPVGERRFRQAVPVQFRDEREKVMDKWDPGCVRPRPRKDFLDGPHEDFDGHEDCLKINVFSPLQRPNNTLLPVMFWIHGGGFVGGTSAEAKYNPRELMHRAIDMDEPFVFVSINYRLGAFGFTASPPEPAPPPTPPHIPTRAPTDLDLNVGLKDQLVALRWVQHNIDQFGGDKSKVVMVGHSAGAISVGLHQLYSSGEGLFRGAFMLSGAPTSFPVPFPHDASARTLHPLPGPAQCPSPVQREHGPPRNEDLLQCLRELSTERMYQVGRTLTDDSPMNAWFPYYATLEGEWGTGEGNADAARGQGGWLDVRPSQRIIRGDYDKVPVIMGAVVDEGTRFVSKEIVEGQDEFLEVVKDIFDFTYGAVKDLLEPIFDFYPPDPAAGSPYGTGAETFGLTQTYKRLSSFVGDILFQAPRRHFLRETPKDFGEDSWNYLYVEPREGAEPRLGVQHGADLPAWFGHPDAEDEPMIKLTWEMTGYLINFVNHLSPNGPGLPYWPQYGMDRLTLQLARANTTVVADNDRLDAMRFLNVNNPIFSR